MDDVQTHWYNEIVINLTMTHYMLQIPLTISIIPNRPGYGNFTSDLELVEHLRRMLILDKSLFEIAQHGWNHTDYNGNGEFSGRPYDEQRRDIARGKEVLKEAFEDLIGDVTTFVPPFDMWDENTSKVLRELGYRVLSSNALREGRLYDNFDKYGMLFLGWSIYIREYVRGPPGIKDSLKLLAETLSCLSKYNVCVVNSHPQDFSVAEGFEMNQTSYRSYLNFLKLLKMISSELNIRFATFSSYLRWKEYGK